MDRLDIAIIAWVNQFAHRSEAFDAAVRELASFNLLKGTPFVLGLAWMWCSGGESQRRRREIVIATACAVVCATVLGRILAVALPFRLRPVSRTDIDFVLPYTMTPMAMRHWSAFPSDTAMIYAALATGFWFVSRPLAVCAHLYAAVMIAFPRLYIGLHHPSDLVVGAAMGTAVSALANRERVRRALAAWPLRLAERRPQTFAVVVVFVATQMAATFDDLHLLLRGTIRMAVAEWRGRNGAAPPPGLEERGTAAHETEDRGAEGSASR